MRQRTLMIIAMLFLRGSIAFAQHIPEEYKLVGEVSITDKEFPYDLYISDDGKILGIFYDIKKGPVDFYSIPQWKKLQTFKFKGWAYRWDSFRDSLNPQIFYFGGRGSKYHQMNIATGEYKLLSRKKIEDFPYTDYVMFSNSSTSYHGDVTMNMIPEEYIITHDSRTAKIYIWKGLIQN